MFVGRIFSGQPMGSGFMDGAHGRRKIFPGFSIFLPPMPGAGAKRTIDSSASAPGKSNDAIFIYHDAVSCISDVCICCRKTGRFFPISKHLCVVYVDLSIGCCL